MNEVLFTFGVWISIDRERNNEEALEKEGDAYPHCDENMNSYMMFQREERERRAGRLITEF